jgi:hypothetical protein
MSISSISGEPRNQSEAWPSTSEPTSPRLFAKAGNVFTDNSAMTLPVAGSNSWISFSPELGPSETDSGAQIVTQ